jgi:hypothetical protein
MVLEVMTTIDSSDFGDPVHGLYGALRVTDQKSGYAILRAAAFPRKSFFSA